MASLVYINWGPQSLPGVISHSHWPRTPPASHRSPGPIEKPKGGRWPWSHGRPNHQKASRIVGENIRSRVATQCTSSHRRTNQPYGWAACRWDHVLGICRQQMKMEMELERVADGFFPVPIGPGGH